MLRMSETNLGLYQVFLFQARGPDRRRTACHQVINSLLTVTNYINTTSVDSSASCLSATEVKRDGDKRRRSRSSDQA